MPIFESSQVIYEDNHLIIVNKHPGQLVQGDKTGDLCLADAIKQFLKDKYQKPGNVFCGVVHRLDRPTSGIVVFAKTSKALERMNAQFKQREPRKTYWVLVENQPKEDKGTLRHYLKKNEAQNKSYAVAESFTGAKQAVLHYQWLASSDHYHLLEVQLETGRHHQIRAQLSHHGCSIRGDVKYGARRPNPDGSIGLHARKISFNHPTTLEAMSFEAAPPDDGLWNFFLKTN